MRNDFEAVLTSNMVALLSWRAGKAQGWNDVTVLQFVVARLADEHNKLTDIVARYQRESE